LLKTGDIVDVGAFGLAKFFLYFLTLKVERLKARGFALTLKGKCCWRPCLVQTVGYQKCVCS